MGYWYYDAESGMTEASRSLLDNASFPWRRLVSVMYYYYYWSLLYSAILRFRADSLRSHVILQEWIAFYSAFLNIHRSGVLTALAWLVPHETAAISARSVHTIQPCTMSLHASHIRKMYACLAVICHLHFWQNDRGLLRATAVTRGWIPKWVSTEGWPWRRKFSRRSCRYSNPRPFDHESGALTTELSPPHVVSCVVV